MEPTVCIETQTFPEQKAKRGRPRKVDMQNLEPKVNSGKIDEVKESTKVALPLSN